MNRSLATIALAATLALGGCTWREFESALTRDEQFVIATVQKIKAGAAVVAADVEAASGVVCAAVPSAQAALTQVILAIGANPGPKTQGNLLAAQAALAAVGAYCANPRGSGLKTLLAAWTGLQAARSAINRAAANAGA